MLAGGALFTDLYQLTMAQLYVRTGLAGRRVRFDYTFRTNPDYDGHRAGFAVAAGLGPLLEWMEGTRFGPSDVAALRSLPSGGGGRLFGEDFLEWLSGSDPFGEVTMRAVPEGRVVHPDTPVAVVEAPLASAQLLETPLLNHLNYSTLIATKAARVREAAQGRPVLEFGLRRAPGRAGDAATRAALIGGADLSSNVGESLDLGFEPKGTHAHSLVQVFLAAAGGELDAFRAYADVYPDDCLLLVDTIDTLESGVPNAIRVFEELRRRGHEPVGIRLDSGDLAYLAVRSARMLDDAGFPRATIVLSGDLDELAILQILTQITVEAPRYGLDPGAVRDRLTFGVGSRLVTSRGAPALDGVYKVVAVDDGRGSLIPVLKISDSPEKTVDPGPKSLWRIYDERGFATADLIALDGESPVPPLDLRHRTQSAMRRVLQADRVSAVEPLLVDVLRSGRRLPGLGGVAEARERREADVSRLDPGVRRLIDPHPYHVSLTPALWDLKAELVGRYRGGEGGT